MNDNVDFIRAVAFSIPNCLIYTLFLHQHITSDVQVLSFDKGLARLCAI